MLLDNLLHGKESSNLILLQDSLEASAKPLLLSFVTSLLQRVDLVCLITFELPPDRFLSVFNPDLRSRLLSIDAYSDYLKWNLTSDDESDRNLVFFDTNISNFAKKVINRKCSVIKSDRPVKVAIAIDCINKLIRKSLSHTCQVLCSLLQGDKENSAYQVEQVVAVLHSDLHDNHVMHALSSVASTVLDIFILPSTQTNSQTDVEHNEEVENYCKALHIRKTGKVLKRKQKFTINNQFGLTEFDEEDWTPKPKAAPPVESEPTNSADPLSDLTFNLKLTKQEQEARANTHLPYMHHTKGAEVQIHQRPIKESQIFYQPDEADDFDEDDPDDDLDI